MNKIIRILLINMIVGMAVDGIYAGVKNRSHGKTFFGKERKHMCVDWKGNVVLGSNDYKVEA